jgi:integrase
VSRICPERRHRGAVTSGWYVFRLFSRAAEEWLRYAEHDRACKPTTMRDYRRALAKDVLPEFGDLVLEDVTGPMIEAWRSRLTVCARTKNKLLTILNGIFRRAIKAFGVRHNPVSEVERLRCRTKIELEVFSPEEVKALVRAAESEQDAAIYLTAAFTGLRRGELIALRWRDVDFAGSVLRVRASYAANTLTTPKSGKVRSVPLATEVAAALARLSASRAWSTGDDDLVFVGEFGSYVDGSTLRRRYVAALQRANLRQLRFHDLRHTFGTRMIAKADILRVKEWMGHADVQTTMRYLHFVPRPDDARLVDEAFADDPPVSYSRLRREPALDRAAMKPAVPADPDRRERVVRAPRVVVEARHRNGEKHCDLVRGHERLVERHAFVGGVVVNRHSYNEGATTGGSRPCPR